MIRRDRIDLVVVKVEMMRRAGRSAAVKPTIRNRCPDSTERDVEVAMAGVTTSFGTLRGNQTVTLGHWIGVADGDSFRIAVDYGNNIGEINESNNVCTVRLGRSARKTQRCN